MHLADLTWPRRTERCTLRLVTTDDASGLWGYWRLREVATWTGGGDASEDELRTRLEDPERRSRRLVVEHEGRIVGDLVIFPRDGWAQRSVSDRAEGVEAELGWAFDPAYGGRGLATEAVRELLAVCLTPAPGGLGLRRVTAECFADNAPSWRLMERLGMRREGHQVANSLHAELGWLDGYSYALLAEEWPPLVGGAGGPLSGGGRARTPVVHPALAKQLA